MQSTNHILMIDPAVFYANPETMDSNHYQDEESAGPTIDKTAEARKEFQGLRDMLVDNGICITEMKGRKDCPDHIFPNWLSTMPDGRLALYKMKDPSRKRELTPQIVDLFSRSYKLDLDFRDEPTEGANLESTASICRDHVNKIGYAALSARTDIRLAERWADHFGYKLIPFDTQSHTGKPIYHTDVLMHIGSEVATICAECISDDAQRKMVLDSLNATHEVVELSMEQLLSFCGNALEVKGPEGEKILVMSEAAYKALKPEQIKVYEAHLDKILHTPLYTVERYGGGSARCMMLELF
ncbi:MAG: hypothetical protein CL561_03645 [Alphaproteobacteria bacterium]|nr:hypothetical protein [Alphaproteobacteria bacterium]|tara:strand:+ start:8185 stop:9078 length:894 start_codon:yes stop_codon:yes gene_type:complete